MYVVNHMNDGTILFGTAMCIVDLVNKFFITTVAVTAEDRVLDIGIIQIGDDRSATGPCMGVRSCATGGMTLYI
jgi:hypothetical protein